jgi:hypothetical protein
MTNPKATVEKLTFPLLSPDGGNLTVWAVIFHTSSGREVVLERRTKKEAVAEAKELGIKIAN